ncbi:MAG: hypothetical protein ORN21_00915 [Methylophilaceae bacterium]|nr:hypothetical protein [Methylophilaceae bacterium]
MKCKAHATQEARHNNELDEFPSSAPPSHSPVQTVLQDGLNLPTLWNINHHERRHQPG